MTILHVACLPFPTHQGTQAAIDAMLRASSELGRPVDLLTYPRGAYEPDGPYPIHRLPDFPRVRSLRSGPSVGKLVLDARCILGTRRLAERLRPEAIVAHHIEAAMAALAANVGPVYYLAHTSLEHELPAYFSRVLEAPIATLGRQLEARVCRRAAGVATVAPSLSDLLSEQTMYVPIPWRTSKEAAPTPRDARRAIAIPIDGPVCLYAGNLDRYQGWEDLIVALAALRRRHPSARLLIASESDATPVRRQAARAGLANAVHVRRLDSELARRQVHAAADLAWVPRRTPGGLPIKMLDAFARGLPTIATQRATAALPIDAACIRVPDDDPGALAEAADHILGNDALAHRLESAALAYLEHHHSAEAFDAAMQRFLSGKGEASIADANCQHIGKRRLFLDPHGTTQVPFSFQLALENQHGGALGRIGLIRTKTHELWRCAPPLGRKARRRSSRPC